MLKVIAMMKRKPGLTMNEFIEYYETRHAPLMNRLQQPELIGYKRNFVNLEGAIITDGVQPWFDVVTELFFADRAAYDRVMARLSEPELTRIRSEDENNFLDRRHIHFFLVEEKVTTR